jgi:nucleoside-diphosphate-sugar epimerase
MKFTIFGSQGFIGGAIARHLEVKGYDVYLPSRLDPLDNLRSNLGNVIYCIGLTGNFRIKPFETVEAHVCKLASILRASNFDSWLYLSSTRIYSQNDNVARESSRLSVFPDSDGIYNISKLLGESLCLSLNNEKIRVARLSNVYGKGQSTSTFLGSVIDDVRNGRFITINESPDSMKDYISLEDVIEISIKIAIAGNERIYNVASGMAISHYDVARTIEETLNVAVNFSKYAQPRVFPSIDISKIRQEFNFAPRDFLHDLPALLKNN